TGGGVGRTTVLPLGAASNCADSSEVASRNSSSLKLNVLAKCELSVLFSTTITERDRAVMLWRTVLRTVRSSRSIEHPPEAATAGFPKAITTADPRSRTARNRLRRFSMAAMIPIRAELMPLIAVVISPSHQQPLHRPFLRLGSSENWISEGRLVMGKIVVRRCLFSSALRIARHRRGGHGAFRIEQVIVARA